eukprot:Clim_evm27s7 gene=Clim_evmTU27s7
MTQQTTQELIRDQQPYTAYYCEENAFLLGERLYNENYLKRSSQDGISTPPPELVCISNVSKSVLLSFQRAAQKPEAHTQQYTVCWDYHVVVAYRGRIYDLDTMLPFPIPAEDYIRATFMQFPKVQAKYRPIFRCLPFPEVGRHFYSDRSHMLNRQSGEYQESPPPWDPIMRAPPSANEADPNLNGEPECWDLASCIDMTSVGNESAVTGNQINGNSKGDGGNQGTEGAEPPVHHTFGKIGRPPKHLPEPLSLAVFAERLKVQIPEIEDYT